MTESLHALSGAYVVDALDDHEREIFEEHLPGCLDCRAEVASLREATAELAHDAAVTPPASLRASVLTGIAAVRPLPPLVADPEERDASGTPRTATVTPLRGRRPRRRVATAVAGLAAAAAVATGVVLQPWQDGPPVSTISAADQVVTAGDAQKVSLGFTDGSRADVYRSKSKGQAVVVTHGMAAPPSGKAFELWLRDAAGVMHPAGMMRNAGDNKVLLRGDAAKATAVGITVEPSSGSRRPTTKPIAMFDLSQGTA